MSSRFLDSLEKNRLDALVNVGVSARCGAFTDTLLSPLPPLHKRSKVK